MIFISVLPWYMYKKKEWDSFKKSIEVYSKISPFAGAISDKKMVDTQEIDSIGQKMISTVTAVTISFPTYFQTIQHDYFLFAK